MAVRGIKAKIALNVALLLLLSAIITDVLVIAVVQNVFIRETVGRSRDSLESMGRYFAPLLVGNPTKLLDEQKATIALWLGQTHITAIQVVDGAGRIFYQQAHSKDAMQMVEGPIRKALNGRQIEIQEQSLIWAAFWWHPRAVIISMPIKNGERTVGALGAIVSLTPIYQNLRQYNKPILFYILINTLILTLIGLYRIFKLYLRPIERIVRQADDYHEDGDLFFAFRMEDNELNRLSSSLNRMLMRIKEDKKILQETIDSLEHANVELKRAQNDIIRAEKLASVGRLAAGIAHEIGNPIGIVLGYIDLLKQPDLDLDDKTDFLKRTEDEIQRINKVIRQLLDLARPQETRSQRVILHHVIDNIVDVLRQQPIMSQINIVHQFGAEEDGVWCNADQLRQVFLNLLLNAADAIQAGPSSDQGVITIRTSCLGDEDQRVPRHARITFEDNGAGIAPDRIQNVFDPFYTTKEPGKGTGLGLAVSYMIIERLGGTIVAASRVGHGSTFTVELPLAGEPETGLHNQKSEMENPDDI